MLSKNELSNLLLDQSKDLIWMINSDLQLIYANDAYMTLMKQMTGVEKKLYEPVLVDGLGEGYIKKWKGYYEKALAGVFFEIEEHYHNSATNQINYDQISFKPLIGEDQVINAVACQSRDITKIVKYKSEADQLLNASMDVFCTVNEIGDFAYVSGASTLQWGYAPEELVGTPYIDLVLEDDLEKTKEIATAVHNGQITTTFANRYKKKDGGIAYNLWSTRWDADTKLMYATARDGSEKLEQDKTIYQSEQRFKALVQEGSDLLSILDLEGNYKYVSPSSLSVLGIPPEYFMGRNAFDFVHPDDVPRTMASMASLANQNTVRVEPFRFQNEKKEWRWVETVLTNLLDNPAVNGIVANSRDITETVNSQKEIEANEQFSRTVLESSPDCLKILDLEGRLQFMNVNGLCQMEIDDFSTVKNKEWCTLWGRENETMIKDALCKALAGETTQFTASCTTAKGTNKWWDVMVSPVGNPVQQFISVSRDITKKKEEEQRLKLLESVIINTNDAVLITEAEPFDEPGNRIIYVNEAFTKMTGYEPEEVIGKSPRMLQGPNSDKEALARLGSSLRNWESSEITVINYKKNGEEFWVNFTVKPVAVDKGFYTHWIAIERDVTEQKIKELEKELIAQISTDFNGETNYISAANALCKSISKYGNFDWVEVWTTNLDENKFQLISHHMADMNDEAFYDHVEQTSIHETSPSLENHVWKERQPILWASIANDENFPRWAAAKEIGLKSVLGIPLIYQEEVVGVLNIGIKRDVNELKKYSPIFKKLERYIGSELHRKKLENELSHLFNTIPDLLCLTDFSAKILKINKAGCELLGYNEAEILHQNVQDFVHPADKEIFFNEMERLLTGAPSEGFENRFLTRFGKIVWLSWNCRIVEEERLVYASAKNITEEKKLRELNRQVANSSKIGSWEMDFVEQTYFWSDSVHQLHETDPNSYSPDLSNSINFYREDFRAFVQATINDCIHTGTAFDFEAVIVTTTNKEIWVRVIGNAECVDDICTRIYGSFQNINSVKESEHRLISLVDNLPGVVYQYVINPDGTDALRYVTGEVKQIWGFTAKEVTEDITLIWNQLILGGDFEEVQKSIQASIETKSRWTVRFKYVLPNGELRIHLGNGSPIFFTDGTILFNSIVIDITKQVKNEELLAQASEMARIGSWEMNLVDQEGSSVYGSPMVREILEVDEQYDPNLTGALEFYVEESQYRIKQRLAALTEEGIEFEEELLLITAKGNERWVRCIGKAETVNNKITKIFGSFQDVDDRKRSEIKLAESENRFRTILEAEPECIKLLNADGKLLMMNPAGLAMIGAESEEQVLGKSLLSILLPDHHAAFSALTKKVFNGGSGKLVFEIVGFKGTHRWMETHAVPMRDEQGKIVSLLGVTRDITERRKAEEEIRDSEEKRRLIMSGALDAIICMNTDGAVTFWNPQAETILGWKEAEVMGQQLSELIIPHKYRKFHKAGLEHYLKTGEEKALNRLLELTAIKKCGEEFPVELTIIPVRQGGDLFFCAFIRDITQRKQAEASLIQSNERFEKVTEATNDAIWDWNVKDNTLYWGGGLKKLFGHKTEKIIPTHNSWAPHIHPEDYDRVRHSFQQTLDSDKDLWVEEYRYKKSDGTYATVMDRGIVIRNADSTPQRMIGAMTDITERKQYEENLVALNKSLSVYTSELQRSNEELEQFAFVASHDLQEPLRMVSSFMELVKRKYGDRIDEKGHEYIFFAIDGAKRMKQIVLDLLQYSKAKRPTEGREVVDFNEVLEDFKVLRRKFITDKNASILSDHLPTLNTYKAPITQILHCLLDNAIKYSSSTVDPVVEIKSVLKGDEWEFSIKDNGIGIEAEFYEKIFIIFQRLHNKDAYSGTGIGLSIAKRHVEFLGGRIWLDSKLGEGTVFYFTIPKTD